MSDTHPLTQNWSNEQKNHWLMDNSTLIWASVRKYLHLFSHNSSIDLHDLYQIASMAVLPAFETYDPKRDVKFSTYATFCMNQSLKMATRHEYAIKRFSYTTSLDDENTRDFLQGDFLLGKNLSPEDQYVCQEQLQNIYDFVLKQAGKDAPIIFTVLCNEITQSNAADLIQCSQARISQKVKKIRRGLTAEFQEEE